MSLYYDSVSLVSVINLPETIDQNTSWDVAATKNTILIVFAKPISKIYRYKIIKPNKYIPSGTVNLITRKIANPVNLQSTEEFIFVQTTNNGILTIKADS